MAIALNKLGTTIGQQENTQGGVSHFYQPMRKILPGETQFVEFGINIGTSNISGSHIYIMLDSMVGLEGITGGILPLQGRGATLFDISPAATCPIVSFEHFGGDSNGNANTHPGDCSATFTWVNNRNYWVRVAVNDTVCALTVRDSSSTGTILFDKSAPMVQSAWQDYDCSNIFIGHTSKDTSNKVFSLCSINTGFFT